MILPIACLRIDQHFLESLLFSSNAVLKYNVFIFRFNLLNIVLWFLYFLIFSAVGLLSLRDNNFALVIDDASRAGVNHGSRLMYLDLTFTSRNGNDSLNAVIYNIRNFEYAKFEHSVLKISLKSVFINLFWKMSMFTALNYLLLCLLVGDFFSLPRKIQKVPKWSATSLMMIPELWRRYVVGVHVIYQSRRMCGYTSWFRYNR